jgi:segregation and condensation protein A
MEMTFKLQVFEGPLPLLLHLIDINKIDIYDIPIAMITDQYLAYIHEMEIHDMDVASEFLVMAATLLKIKSRMLLPVEKDSTDAEAEDPREELVERLLEYKMFKYIAGELRDQSVTASRAVYRGQVMPDDLEYTPPPVDLDTLVGDLDLQDLGRIFREVMKRRADKIDPIRSRYGQIEEEPVNYAEKSAQIRRTIRQRGKRFSFRGLLTKQSSKEEIIVTFLVILELMKDGTVTARQDQPFDDILIEVRDDG